MQDVVVTTIKRETEGGVMNDIVNLNKVVSVIYIMVNVNVNINHTDIDIDSTMDRDSLAIQVVTVKLDIANVISAFVNY